MKWKTGVFRCNRTIADWPAALHRGVPMGKCRSVKKVNSWIESCGDEFIYEVLEFSQCNSIVKNVPVLVCLNVGGENKRIIHPKIESYTLYWIVLLLLHTEKEIGCCVIAICYGTVTTPASPALSKQDGFYVLISIIFRNHTGIQIWNVAISNLDVEPWTQPQTSPGSTESKACFCHTK